MEKTINFTIDGKECSTEEGKYLVEAAKEKNVPTEKTEEILEKLRRSGDIFEPKRGFIQKL